MISPVSLNDNTTLLETISSKELIELYRKSSAIDVSYLEKIAPEIKLYRCNDSGYMFYTPAAAAGDGNFYAQLSKQEWYYSHTRWEHIRSIELFPDKGEMLEMGCGAGYFLGLLKEKKPGINAVGLEINENAIAEGKQKGLNIIGEDVIEFSKTHEKQFDIVCSFQVMEHVYEVRQILEAQISLLKKGGCLVIGVPNNDSYVGSNKHISRCLNMPPHHMGRWSDTLFSYIEKEFKLKKIGLYTEPFSESGYPVCHYNHMLKIFKSHFLVKIWYALQMPNLFKGYFLKKYKKREHGHTILAFFHT